MFWLGITCVLMLSRASFLHVTWKGSQFQTYCKILPSAGSQNGMDNVWLAQNLAPLLGKTEPLNIQWAPKSIQGSMCKNSWVLTIEANAHLRNLLTKVPSTANLVTLPGLTVLGADHFRLNWPRGLTFRNIWILSLVSNCREHQMLGMIPHNVGQGAFNVWRMSRDSLDSAPFVPISQKLYVSQTENMKGKTSFLVPSILK